MRVCYYRRFEQPLGWPILRAPHSEDPLLGQSPKIAELVPPGYAGSSPRCISVTPLSNSGPRTTAPAVPLAYPSRKSSRTAAWRRHRSKLFPDHPRYPGRPPGDTPLKAGVSPVIHLKMCTQVREGCAKTGMDHPSHNRCLVQSSFWSASAVMRSIPVGIAGILLTCFVKLRQSLETASLISYLSTRVHRIDK